jgi:glutamine synthetase
VEVRMTSPGFAARHGLWTAEQQDAADRLGEEVATQGLESIRLSWPDQHGILRGKSYSATAFASALRTGAEITMAPFFFDTANAIVFNPFSVGGGFDIPELSGSPNVVMLPDPTTFRVLPWAPETGWVLCDLYMRDGSPFPFAPRHVLRTALKQLGAAGYDLVAAIEMEWYLTRMLEDNLNSGDLGGPGSPGKPPESHRSRVATATCRRGTSTRSTLRCARSGKTSSRSGCRCVRWRTSGRRARSRRPST